MSTFVIAVTRWARPVQEEAAALAPILGKATYDVKLALSGPLPVIAARTSEPHQAEQLLSVFQQRGHGVVACDLSKIASSEAMITPRDFALEGELFAVHDPERGQHQVPYREIVALIRAMHATSTMTVQSTSQRKLSASRAVISGGLLPTKKVSKTKRVEETEREQVVYLFGPIGTPPILLSEGRLHYKGLGGRMGATRSVNFSTVVSLLQERAPQAFYDDRLLTQRPRSASDGVAESNIDVTVLAAHLLTLAMLGGQL